MPPVYLAFSSQPTSHSKKVIPTLGVGEQPKTDGDLAEVPEKIRVA